MITKLLSREKKQENFYSVKYLEFWEKKGGETQEKF